MTKTSVPIKVAVGYAIIIAIFGVATWMVYGNTRTFMHINRTEQAFTQRRDIIDSLVYSFMQMNNQERAICLGDVEQWDDFERSLHRTIALSERLQAVLTKTTQDHKIDSLQSLLRLKRDNTLLIMRMMAQNHDDRFLAEKVNSLHQGTDSVIIHPKAAEVKEDKETVYEVVKSRKGFFARLADAFKRQHTDTVSVTQNHQQHNDSVQQRIDIAHDVANVLSDIAQKDVSQKRWQRMRLRERERQQQRVSIRVAEQTDDLLRDIRGDERKARQVAFEKNTLARRDVMAKVVLLAIVSLLSACVLVYFVWRDVKRAQRDRERLRDAKDKTERLMAQRERLMLTITHDIKAPAASISGFTTLLSERVADDAQATSFTHNINASATHLLRLVNALLDYHSLESGRVEVRATTFSPARLLEESVDAIRPQATAKGLRVTCNTSGCLQRLLKADAFRIKQIVDNLLSNACKYTSEGGITVKACTTGDRLVVSVADTGCGMTDEETRRVFNAFTRLRGAQGTEGVGLGLSIVQELVTLLHGDIHVTSAKGRGTTFRLSVPVEPVNGNEPQPATTAPAPRPMRQAVTAPAITLTDILVLDDDPLQRQLLQEMLRRLVPASCTITLCQWAEDLLRRVERHHPSVCLVDVEMPDISGTEVARRIGAHDGMRIVAMTAHDASIMPQLKEAGFDDCLFKPISMERLAMALGLPADATVPDTHGDSAGTCDLSALTAFASGDQEAEREILHSFAQELKGHIHMLETVLSTSDRKQAAHVGHKALPLMTLIGARCVPQLQALSPEHVGELADGLFLDTVRKVIDDLRAVLQKVEDTNGG